MPLCCCWLPLPLPRTSSSWTARTLTPRLAALRAQCWLSSTRPGAATARCGAMDLDWMRLFIALAHQRRKKNWKKIAGFSNCTGDLRGCVDVAGKRGQAETQRKWMKWINVLSLCMTPLIFCSFAAYCLACLRPVALTPLQMTPIMMWTGWSGAILAGDCISAELRSLTWRNRARRFSQLFVSLLSCLYRYALIPIPIAATAALVLLCISLFFFFLSVYLHIFFFRLTCAFSFFSRMCNYNSAWSPSTRRPRRS